MTNINNEKEEKKEPKKMTNSQKGLLIVASVGVVAGVYGWLNGRTSGYRDGYRRGRLEGMAYTVDNFAESMKVVFGSMNESKGD